VVRKILILPTPVIHHLTMVAVLVINAVSCAVGCLPSKTELVYIWNTANDVKGLIEHIDKQLVKRRNILISIMEHVKYMRTRHLPFSPGASNDDKIQQDISHLKDKEVVVSEKLDGMCVSFYKDGIHARSLSGANHPSMAWVKAVHASIAHRIPNNMRIVGENLFAVHSIKYNKLPTYFLVFGIYYENLCLSWDKTTSICEEYGLTTVPVLYRGVWKESTEWYTGVSRCGGEQEGFVVRLADSFPADKTFNVLKWVRPNHVTVSEHWSTQEIKRNGLQL
jgi:hypothetical protein